MVVVGIRIPEEEKKQFAKIAKQKGLTVSTLARILIQNYLKGEMNDGL